MAESVVALLVTKIEELLASKLQLISSVHENVRSLKDKFQWLQSFLKDVDARRRDNERMKVWVSQIQDVAFQAEDALDRYLSEVQFQRGVGCMGSLKNCARYTRRLNILQQLATEIEGIKRRLQEISASKSEFGIEFRQTEGEASSSYDDRLRRTDKAMPTVEEINVVGFEKDVEILTEELVKGDPRRATVSIVGMGGLGKTTLARKVYNGDDAKGHFDCRAWIYVSQRYNRRELLQVMLERFAGKKELAEMTSDDLADELAEHLRTRRYLLVIDDIWNVEAWDDIRNALPDGNNGSRIMVTSRNKEVGQYVDPRGFIHEPRCLSEGESWDLFCLKAFGRKDGCPPELIEIGKEMVPQCAGLPLGIIVLGGLLSRKPKTETEWRKVLRRIKYELHEKEGTGGQIVQRILVLSYYDLPHYLRSCFLYFGLYPEDWEIDVEELIQRWVAEGFIQPRGEQTMEEVAEDYLEELVNRCMVQVVKRNVLGSVQWCRIHDLLHDLSISQGKEDKFLGILAGNQPVASNAASSVAAAGAPRRVAVHQYLRDHPSLPSSLHSLLCFDNAEASLSDQVRLLVNDAKLLRVLHVRSYATSMDDVVRLPKQIGGLVHLRYLGLDANGILDLPSSIGQLRNLQTLRVVGDYEACFVPDALWKIEALRHVIGENSLVMKGRHIHCNSKHNLQTLWGVNAGSWVGSSLGEFTNLRALRMWHILATHVPELSMSLGRLTRLNKLGLVFAGRAPTSTMVRAMLSHLVNHPVLYELVIDLDTASNDLPSCVPNLMVQTPLRFPPSLARLEVGLAGLLSDQVEDLASLESLPNLVTLRLSDDAYTGKVMVFSPRGFRKLQELELSSLGNLEGFLFGDGAMPRLGKIKIEWCTKLRVDLNELRNVMKHNDADIEIQHVGYVADTLEESNASDIDASCET